MAAGAAGVKGNLRGIAPQAGIIDFFSPILSDDSIRIRSDIRMAKADLIARVQRGQSVVSLNMSFGPLNTFFVTETTDGNFMDFEDLIRHGIAPVQSAGNSGNCGTWTPGVGSNEMNGIQVTGTKNDPPEYDCDAQASPLVELAAVYRDVETSDVGDGDDYATSSGTSYSAPMVAGAFAVLRELRPDCGPEAILDVLQWTGTPIPISQATPPFTVPFLNLEAAAGQILLSLCAPAAPVSVAVDESEGAGPTTLSPAWFDRASNEDGFEAEAVPVLPGLVAPGYKDFGPNQSSSGRSPAITDVEAGNVHFDGLTPGSEYQVRVRAFRDTASGRVYSAWAFAMAGGVPAVFETKPPLVYGPPSGVDVTGRTMTSLDIEWGLGSKPAGASVLTSAQVTLVGDGVRVQSVAAVGSPPYTTTFTNLGALRPYDAYIRLCNTAGCGDPSMVRAYTGLPGGDALQPPGGLESPEICTVRSGANTTIQIDWELDAADHLAGLSQYAEIERRLPPPGRRLPPRGLLVLGVRAHPS